MFIFLLNLLILLQGSFQWGMEGHQIVAQIAANRLPTSSREIVSKFLGSRTLSQISTIADSYRASPEGGWTSPCHYVNLPKGAPDFEWDFCPKFCVVKSVLNYTAILTKENSIPIIPCPESIDKEPCALEFLVHFIGDIHQPLHIGYSNDQGGNDVQVDFFGKKTNLHSAWDTSIIERWNKDLNSAVNNLETIIKQNPSIVNLYLSKMDPVQWADESYALVVSTVYDFAVSDGVAILDEQYYLRNLPFVQQRLIAGGVRLGKLLQSILKQ
jgi:hypothetical protein